jgi:hypothetical protein
MEKLTSLFKRSAENSEPSQPLNIGAILKPISDKISKLSAPLVKKPSKKKKAVVLLKKLESQLNGVSGQSHLSEKKAAH